MLEKKKLKKLLKSILEDEMQEFLLLFSINY